MAQGVRQAPDPSAAVAAYAAAAGRVGPNPTVDDAYVRRMVEFNLPDLAESQAQNLVKVDPANDVARAVIAYTQGRRGQAVEALGTIVQAAGGDRPVTDPFVLRTAGQLVAWYDTRADKAQIQHGGGTDQATWFVLFKPGYEMAIKPDTPMPSPGHYRGMHGYDPALPQMRSTFLIEGKGVPAGKDLGDIDMRDIAPTIAHLLNVSLPQAQGKALLP